MYGFLVLTFELYTGGFWTFYWIFYLGFELVVISKKYCTCKKFNFALYFGLQNSISKFCKIPLSNITSRLCGAVIQLYFLYCVIYCVWFILIELQPHSCRSLVSPMSSFIFSHLHFKNLVPPPTSFPCSAFTNMNSVKLM